MLQYSIGKKYFNIKRNNKFWVLKLKLISSSMYSNDMDGQDRGNRDLQYFYYIYSAVYNIIPEMCIIRCTGQKCKYPAMTRHREQFTIHFRIKKFPTCAKKWHSHCSRATSPNPSSLHTCIHCPKGNSAI